VQPTRRSPEPGPVAVKPQPAPPPTVEELPELKLPRAEHVRPSRKDFAESSPLEIPWRILALAAIVIVLGIILWTRRSHVPNASAGSPSNTVQAKDAPPSASTSVPATQPSTAGPSSSEVAAAAAPTPVPPPADHPSVATSSASPATEANNDANTNNKADVTVRTFSKANPKPSEKPAPVLTLVIRATKTSWISVLADGQTVSQETLIAPAHTSVRANREIIARIGNSAGVTFVWNGQEIPAEGAEAEVKTFVFDSAGMRVLPTTQPAPQNQ
jgi:cytoskeletal protein RodZ